MLSEFPSAWGLHGLGPGSFLFFTHSPATLGGHMGSPHCTPGHSGAGAGPADKGRGLRATVQVAPRRMGKPVHPGPALPPPRASDEGPQRACAGGQLPISVPHLSPHRWGRSLAVLSPHTGDAGSPRATWHCGLRCSCFGDGWAPETLPFRPWSLRAACELTPPAVSLGSHCPSLSLRLLI